MSYTIIHIGLEIITRFITDKKIAAEIHCKVTRYSAYTFRCTVISEMSEKCDNEFWIFFFFFLTKIVLIPFIYLFFKLLRKSKKRSPEKFTVADTLTSVTRSYTENQQPLTLFVQNIKRRVLHNIITNNNELNYK